MTKLLFSPWKHEFEKELRNSSKEICIIVPFFSKDGINMLLNLKNVESSIRFITRLNDKDIFNNVISIEGLLRLHINGARIRVHDVKLHSKLYIFDDKSAIVTSSNLTGNGLNTNTEIGVTIYDQTKISELKNYFEHLWDSLGWDIDSQKINEVNKKAQSFASKKEESQIYQNHFKDYGNKIIIDSNTLSEQNIKYWCKFIDTTHYDFDNGMNLKSVINKLGALSFHCRRKPNHIKSDDIIFHVSTVKSKNGHERMVYGRGKVVHQFRNRIDELPTKYKNLHPDLDIEPFCIWLYDIELLNGVLMNGIPLNMIIKEFGNLTFAWSKQDSKNRSPNRALTQYYSHIELTQEAALFLDKKLEERFNEIGRIQLKSSNTIWWNDYISKMAPGQEFIKTPFDITDQIVE